MDIVFADADLGRTCNDAAALTDEHGHSRARAISLRLQALAAADDPASLSEIPGAPHGADGASPAQFVMPVDDSCQLILRAAGHPAADADDESSWRSAASVIVVGLQLVERMEAHER